jgi:hypothetical protein
MTAMEQRKLGTGGLVVSAQGLGCMGMSEFYGRADDAESIGPKARNSTSAAPGRPASRALVGIS